MIITDYVDFTFKINKNKFWKILVFEKHVSSWDSRTSAE